MAGPGVFSGYLSEAHQSGSFVAPGWVNSGDLGRIDEQDVVLALSFSGATDEVVRLLIRAGAPLDHVNNLGWTALIESIVLGNGGKNHTDTLAALVKAGADVNIADRQGVTPLQHARRRGYVEMARILENAGGR